MVKNRYKIILFVAAIVIFGLVFHKNYQNTLVKAQNGTTVGATLCDSQSPDLQISQPISDTSVYFQPINIQGMAYRTSQIDIYLNNVFDHSVAIGSDSVLLTPMSLVEGTNTIKLHAHFSCNGTDSEEILIIRYQPEVPPAPVAPSTDIDGLDTQTRKNSQLRFGPYSNNSTKDGIIQRIKEKLNISDKAEEFISDVDNSSVKKSFHLPTFLTILALLSLATCSVVLVINFIQNGVISFAVIFKPTYIFWKLIVILIVFLVAVFFAV